MTAENDAPSEDQGGTDATAPATDLIDVTVLHRRMDDEYVRQSFRRSWDPEIRRLRRSLRGAA